MAAFSKTKRKGTVGEPDADDLNLMPPMKAGNLRAAAAAENSPPAMGKDLPKKGKGPKRGKAHAGSMMGY